MQTDAVVGNILQALDDNGLSKDTLVIFSSDNGTSPKAKFKDLKKKGHDVNALHRGAKADIWEGGHRVPFIAKWEGVIEPNTSTDQVICLVDFFATLSDITGAPIAPNSAEDSLSFLPALMGQDIKASRKGIIHHSVSGHFAYRQGDWKLILARGSGGTGAPKEKTAAKSPEAQLYNLANDPKEEDNLYHSHPEVAETLLRQLEAYVFIGRSTEGPEAKNDVPDSQIKLWKSGRD